MFCRPSYLVYESKIVLNNMQIFCLGFLFEIFAFHPCSSGLLYIKQVIQIDLCFCHSKSFGTYVILYKNRTIGKKNSNLNEGKFWCLTIRLRAVRHRFDVRLHAHSVLL